MKCKGKTHFPTPDSRVSQVLRTLGGLAHPIGGVSSKFDGGGGGGVKSKHGGSIRGAEDAVKKIPVREFI